MRRFAVNKTRSAHHFKNNIKHTKSPNINRQVMRGGWRM